MTTNWLRGMARSIFFRLLTLAPLMMMCSRGSRESMSFQSLLPGKRTKLERKVAFLVFLFTFVQPNFGKNVPIFNNLRTISQCAQSIGGRL
jgi:hypothetical protein